MAPIVSSRTIASGPPGVYFPVSQGKSCESSYNHPEEATLRRDRPAKRTDWNIKPCSKKRATIQLQREFSADEIEKIQFGVIPEEMEDKWFIYWEDDTLYFHRSWTGICLYVVRFSLSQNGATMISAEVNRDRREYKNTDESHHEALIQYLIDLLLLRKPAAFPSDSSSKGRAALQQWGVVGQAGLGIHPGDKREPRIKLKTRCHLCRHKFRGHPGCMAFPVHRPHDLAIGNRMHDEEYPGDRGYRFEEKGDARREQGPHSYKGRPVAIRLSRVLEDAYKCDFKAEPSVNASYVEFLEYFNRIEKISSHEFVIGASFTYSWMPTTLTLRNENQFEVVAAYLDAIRLGNDVDKQAISDMNAVINNSMVGTSKLLHFVDPQAYPIIDRWVEIYLHGKHSQTRLYDVDHYMSYTCACRRAVEDDRFPAIHKHVNGELRYDVTALRALELIMFLTAKRNDETASANTR